MLRSYRIVARNPAYLCLSRHHVGELCRSVRLDLRLGVRAAGSLRPRTVRFRRRLRARFDRLHDRLGAGRAHGRQARARWRALDSAAAPAPPAASAMVAAVAFGLTSSHVARSCRWRVYLAGLGMVLPQGIAGATDAVSGTRRRCVVAVRLCAASSVAALCGAVVGWLLGQSAWPLARGCRHDGLRHAVGSGWRREGVRRAAAKALRSAPAEKRVEQPAVERRRCRWSLRRSPRPAAPPPAVSAASLRRRRIRRTGCRADAPGRLATGTPWCAPRMNRLQISTGRPPPVACLVGVPSSLPSQTPVTRWRGVADEPGIAEILADVPVLPAAGQPGNARLCAVPIVQRLAPSSRSSSPT